LKKGFQSLYRPPPLRGTRTTNRVLVAKESNFPHGLRKRDRLQPLNGNEVFAPFKVIEKFDVITAACRRFQYRDVDAISHDCKRASRRSGGDDPAYADVTLLRHVHPNSVAWCKYPQGFAVPTAAAPRDEPELDSVIPRSRR
jgi:hypothetical protein